MPQDPYAEFGPPVKTPAKADPYADFGPPVNAASPAVAESPAPVDNRSLLQHVAEDPNNIPLDSYLHATEHGLANVGQGLAQGVQGGWNLLKTAANAWNDPKADVGDQILPDISEQAKQVPGAIHDINQSPDPLGALTKVASDTAGQSAGQLGSMILADKVAAATKNAVPPSAAEIGKNFQPIAEAAKSTPTDIAAPRAIAEQAKAYADSGASAPKVIRDYLRRTAEGPMNPQSPVFYPEGRRFAENAGKLSVSEGMGANPQMKRLVSSFADALDKSNRAAAEQVGMGQQYDEVMRQYAGAKGREQMIANLGDIAKKAAIGALGLEGLHRIISSATKK